jgi:hypothetical protein
MDFLMVGSWDQQNMRVRELKMKKHFFTKENLSLLWECVFDVEILDCLMVFGWVMFAGIVRPVGCPSAP